MNYRGTLRPIGMFLLVLVGSMLVPLLLSLTEEQSTYPTRQAFAVALGVTVGIGAALLALARIWTSGSGDSEQLHRKEGLFIVAVGWIVAGILSAIPYVVSGVLPSWIDAVFESVSGFTTTGASVITEIEILPRSILLWRSMTHLLGGMGIIVLFVAILPALGVGGKFLYRIEATGPSVSGIHPKAVDTARTLWLIYMGITVVEILLLWAAGMTFFDAVCHAFGTMATGGFSTKNNSIAGFGTHIQLIITFFMFLAGVNFSLYYQAWRRRFLFWKDSEFRLYLLLIAAAFVAFTTNVLHQQNWDLANLGIVMRDGIFTTLTIITTTGFGTVDFEQWTPLAQGAIVALMFVGGCAGSTGGGMKVVRVLITVRWVWKQLEKAYRPKAVLPLRINGQTIDREIEESVVGYMLLFMLWILSGVILMLACNHDMVTAITAAISAAANIGPGLGMIGPTENWALLHPVAKLWMSLLMLVGRLEVLAISVLVLPGFWRRY
ncbi:TrkH family potassium uptake protein [bacterium]|nr:TrkH family potassium uptake protein [bacterium]